MTVRQTSQLMDLFSAAYPRYYAGQPENVRQLALKTWATMLEEYPADVVTAASKALIATQKFPPAISEVLDKIRMLTCAPDIGEAQAWALVQKAVRNALYHAEREFDALPDQVRNAVGNPETLRAWAMTDMDELATVVQSNFMRTFRAKAAADAEYRAIPADVRRMIDCTAGDVRRLEAAR